EQLEAERRLTGKERSSLAERMINASDPAEEAKVREEIVRGFYGQRAGRSLICCRPAAHPSGFPSTRRPPGAPCSHSPRTRLCQASGSSDNRKLPANSAKLVGRFGSDSPFTREARNSSSFFFF